MESRRNIIWSPSAKEDLENITDFLLINWNLKIVQKFLTRLNRIINQVVINPNQFPLIHPGLEIRKCVVTKQNTLFYRMKNDKIEIVRIFDTRQDPQKLKIIFE